MEFHISFQNEEFEMATPLRSVDLTEVNLGKILMRRFHTLRKWHLTAGKEIHFPTKIECHHHQQPHRGSAT